jgi:predicted RNase H-like HicB family nuclease
MTNESTGVVERDETGWWIAQVKEAPAITRGRTIAEARRRIREALGLALGDGAAAKRAGSFGTFGATAETPAKRDRGRGRRWLVVSVLNDERLHLAR